MSGSAVPSNMVSAAIATAVPGRPPPTGMTRMMTGMESAASGIEWSQYVTSSSGVGTKSAMPVCAAPHDPGSIARSPA